MGAKHEPEHPEQHRVTGVDDTAERGTPSQAEGDREATERDLAEKGLGDSHEQPDQQAYDSGGQGDPVYTPSQAEGERDEIDEDLREKGEE